MYCNGSRRHELLHCIHEIVFGKLGPSAGAAVRKGELHDPKRNRQEAGVSVSTVSRVINNNSKAASKEVQDRIWEIVRRTGYTPNSVAQSLKLGAAQPGEAASHSLACLFARTPDMMTDLFFNSLARSIEQEAFRHNYLLKYSFSALTSKTRPPTAWSWTTM